MDKWLPNRVRVLRTEHTNLNLGVPRIILAYPYQAITTSVYIHNGSKAKLIRGALQRRGWRSSIMTLKRKVWHRMDKSDKVSWNFSRSDKWPGRILRHHIRTERGSQHQVNLS